MTEKPNETEQAHILKQFDALKDQLGFPSE